MENYNSAALEEFKNVWVFCEQREGKMMKTSLELISEGRKLADEIGCELCGLILGDDVEGMAAGDYRLSPADIAHLPQGSKLLK